MATTTGNRHQAMPRKRFTWIVEIETERYHRQR
jgi:hypothetical protein